MTAYKRMLQQSRDGATRRPGNTKTTKDLDMLRDTQHLDIVMACDMLQALSEEEKARNAQWASLCGRTWGPCAIENCLKIDF